MIGFSPIPDDPGEIVSRAQDLLMRSLASEQISEVNNLIQWYQEGNADQIALSLRELNIKVPADASPETVIHLAGIYFASRSE